MTTLNLPGGSRSVLRRRARRGFTFLEIIVVVAILAILATLIIPRFSGRVEESRITQAQVQIKELAKALELYRLDNGKYPTTEQGLKALVEKPSGEPRPLKWKQYMDAVPKDPWSNEYVYLSPASKAPFDIVSLGPDGKESEDDIKLSDANKPTPTKTP
jgi:general secretion pathway protein G